MATVKQIAERANVSIGTVDRVLHNRGRVSEETRERVLEIVRMLDYTPNRAAQVLASRKKKLHLGFFAMDDMDHPFFEQVNRAARGKAAELERVGVRTSFFKIRLVAENGTYLRSEVDFPEGITLDMLDGAAFPGDVTSCTATLCNRNVPVVMYNNLTSRYQPLASVGCDYYRSGRIAAGLCARSVDKAGEIAIFSEGAADVQVPSYVQRLAGFMDCLNAEFPQCKVVGQFFFTYPGAIGDEEVRLFFREHSNVSVVYLVNPGDYGICTAIRNLDPEQRIRIITNDMADAQKEMVRSGVISATITQEPEIQGSKPLDILYKYLVYGETPPESICYTKLNIHLAENID